MENNNRNYASLVILKSFTQKKYEKAIEKIKKYFNDFENVKIKELGKRKLAYEIKKEKEGIFISIDFIADKEKVLNLKKYFLIDTDILKAIVVSKEC